ncbi:MAG: PKD domain-containing protein, partial [Dinghuibacter sp.]|nr:PKD domain-containing protein [Dinghuibacter sp.]
ESSAPVSVALATVTNGIAGTGVYSGPGTNAAGMFNPAAAGFGVHTIKYVFTTTGGCIDSITRNIQVLAKPAPDFSFPTGCLPTNGLMNFTNLTTLADAQNLSYTWTFGDATPPNNAINPAHTYAAEGNYQVILNAFTNNGCTASDTSMVTVKIRPALSFPVLNAVCESAAPISVAVASVTNGVTGSGVYSGPGTNTAGMFDPAAAGSGIHTIKYVFTTTGGCADSITRNIQVFAKPNVNFSFPNGCLPANGQITFTNLSTIADGQGMLYSWNFGDGSGTSTAQNPTYNYTAENTYPVTLTVNTTNGCTNNRTINVPVSIRPALTYPALTPVCASVTTPFSVATASVTNGITGTGVYSGPGTNAAGQFNPSVAGAGNHTIWYVFTTNGGCKDSVSTNMQVQPKPTSSFTVTPDVCLGQAATITDNSTIGVGAITSWRWDFGDGTTAVNNNGAAFTKTYTTAGPYTVKLVTISSNGCVSDTVSRVINIRPIPVASFNMPASVCFPNRPVQFTNTSTIADNSALTYSWDFGDLSAPSTVTSPAHVYAAIGSYNIRLRATSPYGCFDDSVRVFNSFFDKPVAGFSVTPDTLCQGADNIFTDLSTAPNSTIQNWRWIFDDGSTSTTQNPVKRFINPGNYDV